jgi:hypothetical protein
MNFDVFVNSCVVVYPGVGFLNLEKIDPGIGCWFLGHFFDKIPSDVILSRFSKIEAKISASGVARV